MRNNQRGKRNRLNREIQIKNKRIFIILLIAIYAILFSTFYIIGRNNNEKIRLELEQEEAMKKINAILFLADEEIMKTPIITTQTEEKDTVIKFSVVGNIMCEKPILEDGYNSDTNSYDFSHIFDKIRSYTLSSDIVMGNLETSFTTEEYSGRGKYNSPKEFGKALKDCGFNIVNTTNNNCYSYGIEGINQTIDVLNELEIDHVGTRKQDESRVLIKEVKGIKIAFLSYTYGLNDVRNITDEQRQHINIIDKDVILEDLNNLDKSVEYICVNMHWGNENWSNYKNEPTELTQFLFDNGVDMVIGSHPTSIQPIQVLKNAQAEDAFVAFSTGSFISTSGYKESNVEMILNIEVTKSVEGEVYLSKVTYVPLYLLDNGQDNKNRYVLLPVQDTVKEYDTGRSNITEKIYKTLIQALVNIEKELGKI